MIEPKPCWLVTLFLWLDPGVLVAVGNGERGEARMLRLAEISLKR